MDRLRLRERVEALLQIANEKKDLDAQTELHQGTLSVLRIMFGDNSDAAKALSAQLEAVRGGANPAASPVIARSRGILRATLANVLRDLEEDPTVFSTGGATSSRAEPLRLFISHSSEDVEYAKLLIDLLRNALNLPARQIRCTSVDGYRLEGGADTDEQLRTEIYDAETFIGVISHRSLQSHYVMFELGARWGAKRHLIPLLAPGMNPSELRRPLSNLNALEGAVPAQLHHLVDTLAAKLRVTPSSAAAFQTHIDAIHRLPRTSAGGEPEKPPGTPSAITLEIGYRDRRIDGDRHEYRLYVQASNTGTKVISDWAVEIRVPRRVLEPRQSYPIIEASSTRDIAVMRWTEREHSGPIFPGDAREVVGLDYFIDSEMFWEGEEEFSREVIASFYVAGERVASHRKVLRDLQRF